MTFSFISLDPKNFDDGEVRFPATTTSIQHVKLDLSSGEPLLLIPTFISSSRVIFYVRIRMGWVFKIYKLMKSKFMVNF